MIHSTISNKYHKVVVKLFTFVIWIMLWQVIYWIVGKEVLIVSPFQVIERILELIRDKSFFIQIGMSFIRVLLGFILAVFLGLVAGILTGKSDLFYEILSPFFHVIQATPVASFIILALIWIKTGYVPVFIAFLIVFPIVTSNIATGVKQVDRKLLEMSKVFQFSLNKKLQYLSLIHISESNSFFSIGNCFVNPSLSNSSCNTANPCTSLIQCFHSDFKTVTFVT